MLRSGAVPPGPASLRAAQVGLLLATFSSCWPWAGLGIGDCRLIGDGPPPAGAALADLTAARPFRSYVAVTAVEAPGHHFDVWFRHIEPVFIRLRAWRDAGGKVDIEPESGWFGGMAGPSPGQRPLPPAVSALALDLQQELKRVCRSGRDWEVHYAGQYRAVEVQEFRLHDVNGAGSERIGWYVRSTLAMDDRLRVVEHVVEGESVFGIIRVPAGAQWLTLLPSSGPELLLIGDGAKRLTDQIAAAAQGYASKMPAPELTSLVPPGAPMLPPGYVSRVHARMSISGRRQPSSPVNGIELDVPLDVRDAVFGAGATGTASAALGPLRYTLRATLSPAAARAPSPTRQIEQYAGTLTLHLDDGAGNSWERAYAASGELALEGDAAVAPYGLLLPGQSAPSPEYDALRAEIPAASPFSTVNLAVDVQLSNDPRRR